MTHEIIIQVCNDHGLDIWCSCGATLSGLSGFRLGTITLDAANEIAHKHIEAAEREQGYRVESAIRSEDELVDLRTVTYVEGGLVTVPVDNLDAWRRDFGPQH